MGGTARFPTMAKLGKMLCDEFFVIIFGHNYGIVKNALTKGNSASIETSWLMAS